MRKCSLIASVLGLAVLGSAIMASAAPITIFDDALENGFAYTVPTRESTDTTVEYEGTASVLMTPNGGFDQLGFAGGSSPAIPADATTLTMAINVGSAAGESTRPVSQFIAQLTGGSFPAVNFNDSNGIDSTTPDWTIDGLPGTTLFTRDTWHVLRFDLAAAFSPSDLVPGTTHLASMNVQTNGDTTQSVIHLDSAALVGSSVPEPASIGLLGIAALFGLKRNRKTIAR